VEVELERFGDAALRARLAEGCNTRAVVRVVRALPGVIDVVATERHVLVTFDPTCPPTGVGQAIARALEEPAAIEELREHCIEVRYDGPDLDEVARASGIGRDDVVRLHTASCYVVAAIGFLPGFGYLRGVDPRLTTPRRPTPRPRVPPLSVGLAGPYTGVYPFASPGGWNLLGSAVGFVPFDVQSGAALAIGDQVRFVRVGS
jgi:UPF0271 protein